MRRCGGLECLVEGVLVGYVVAHLALFILLVEQSVELLCPFELLLQLRQVGQVYHNFALVALAAYHNVGRNKCDAEEHIGEHRSEDGRTVFIYPNDEVEPLFLEGEVESWGLCTLLVFRHF